MHIQIVMDHTGDAQHHFDPNDDLAVAESRKRFQELTDSGYTPPSGRARVRRN
jgi:hypothetical protein